MLVVAAAGVGIFFPGKDDTDRFPARGRSGCHLHSGAASRRGVGGAHARRGQASGGPDPPHAPGRGGIVHRRILAARWRQPAERRLPGNQAQAIRSAARAGEWRPRRAGAIFGAAQQIRSAVVFPFNLPPIIGLSTSGGFEYQLENLEGARRRRWGASCRACRGGQPGPAPEPRVFDLHRVQSVDLARY